MAKGLWGLFSFFWQNVQVAKQPPNNHTAYRQGREAVGSKPLCNAYIPEDGSCLLYETCAFPGRETLCAARNYLQRSLDFPYAKRRYPTPTKNGDSAREANPNAQQSSYPNGKDNGNGRAGLTRIHRRT